MQTNKDSAMLLGATLGTGAALTDLTKAVERLKLISAHDALVLMKNSLSAPKLLRILRATCCFGHDLLRKLGRPIEVSSM